MSRSRCSAKEDDCHNRPVWILGHTQTRQVKRFCNDHAVKRALQGNYLVMEIS